MKDIELYKNLPKYMAEYFVKDVKAEVKKMKRYYKSNAFDKYLKSLTRGDRKW